MQTGRLVEWRPRGRIVWYRMCLWDVLANEGRALFPYRNLECILPPARQFLLRAELSYSPPRRTSAFFF